MELKSPCIFLSAMPRSIVKCISVTIIEDFKLKGQSIYGSDADTGENISKFQPWKQQRTLSSKEPLSALEYLVIFHEIL